MDEWDNCWDGGALERKITNRKCKAHKRNQDEGH